MYHPGQEGQRIVGKSKGETGESGLSGLSRLSGLFGLSRLFG